MLALLRQQLIVHRIHLEETFINYEIDQDSSNIQFLVDYFAPQEKQDQESGSRDLKISLQEVSLKEVDFKFIDHRQHQKNQGVDFSDLAIQSISGNFNRIQWDSSGFHTQIKNLRFQEKSGFRLNQLNAVVSVSEQRMEFDDLFLKTDHSQLGRYLSFSYSSFDDFNDFVKKVHIQATLDQVDIDSRDIAYFAPTVNHVKFAAAIPQARLEGLVADFKVSDVLILTG